MTSIFGWSYPPGAASDPFAPYNQEEQQTNEDVEIAFGDYDSPYHLYRSTYKYTDCGPSVGFTVRGYRYESDQFGEQWEKEFTETYYHDKLAELGSWSDMAERGLLVVGIEVSSIVEGVDYDTSTHVVEINGDEIKLDGKTWASHDFVAGNISDAYWEAVRLVNEEGRAIWMETHGCDTCRKHFAEQGTVLEEWDDCPVWKDCPDCEGSGCVK